MRSLSALLVNTFSYVNFVSFVYIFQLLIDYGLMKPLDKGTYFYLPILQRSIDKANAIIERFMTKIDAQKISIPNLTPIDFWKDSGMPLKSPMFEGKT